MNPRLPIAIPPARARAFGLGLLTLLAAARITSSAATPTTTSTCYIATMSTPPPPPAIRLLLDFDSTLTTHDTLSTLALLPPHPPLPWSHFVTAYLADLAALLPPPPTPPGGSQTDTTTYHQELAHLESYLPLERRSIERLERAGYFAGLTPGEVERGGWDAAWGGRVGVRRGWWEVFTFLSGKREVEMEIISVNWSAKFVRGVLGGGYQLWLQDQQQDETGEEEEEKPPAHPQLPQIHANELLTSPLTNLTTGEFSRRSPDRGLWTAGDKRGVMAEILARRRGEGEGEGEEGMGGDEDEDEDEDVLTIYVGDSPTDLACLLAADVGVVVGRDRELGGILGRLGVRVVEGMGGAGAGVAVGGGRGGKGGKGGLDEEVGDGGDMGDVRGKKLFRIEDFVELGRWLEEEVYG